MVKIKDALRNWDYLLVLCVLLLGVTGVLMIYSYGNAPATPLGVANQFGDIWTRQLVYIISGTVLMFFLAMVDYRHITKFYIYIYGFMMAFLLVVMFIGADEGTNVARWLWIPVPGFGRISMQPSEFSKLFMILFLSKFLDVNKDRFNKVWCLAIVLVLIAVPVYLVTRQPSLSASLVILSLSLVMLFVAGLYFRTILIGLGFITPIAVIIWLDIMRAEPIFITRVLGNFQWVRIETWRNSVFGIDQVLGTDAFMQTQQSLYSITAGGVTGRGFLNNSHVIHGHNDFIFSIFSEQFGFIGAAVLLGVTALLIVRCILIALRAPDLQGRLIASGVAGMLIFETFVHVSVTTNFLPNTGMPYPFLSFGGSMIWVHMMAMGVVLNVGIPRTKGMFEDEDDDV